MYRVFTHQQQSPLLSKTDLDLFEESKKLSLHRFDQDTDTAMAALKTLRGQLQRWRDQTAKAYDEGIQFVLEDNLLNHLLE